MKKLCDARGKLEMSSNLADIPTLANVLPPHEIASENELTQCVSILSMRTHLKQSIDKKVTGDVLSPMQNCQ